MYDIYLSNYPTDPSEDSAQAAAALQIALDRRDNGGDAGSQGGR